MPAKFNVQANLNPYAPPTISKIVTNVASSIPNADKIRQEHLATESAIAAFGWFHLVLAAFQFLGLFLSLILTVLIVLNPPDEFSWLWHIFRLFMTVCIGLWHYSVGIGLRKLDESARTNGTILNIFNIPIGVGIWFFMLVWSAKGSVVFSDHYKEVIEQTPQLRRHVTWTTFILIFLPIVMIVLLGILLTVLIAAGIITPGDD
ncbi:MAG: hypothetical protein ABL888_04250 [Pirellulaceae bacterium]